MTITNPTLRYQLFALVFFSISAFGQNYSTDRYGKGLTSTAKDSSFHVKFGFRFQTLYAGTTNLETNEYSEQLLTRRARLKFDGFAYDPSIIYQVELALSNRDHSSGQIPESRGTASIVLDAVVQWEFVDGWQLWFGQTKLPGNRERVISSQKLQFVDRSLVNALFNLDRDLGFQLRHKSGESFVFKQALAVSLGEGRNIAVDNPDNGRQITGRLEFLPLGDFTSKGDYFGGDLKREPTPKLSIGITGDINNGAVRERGNLGDFTDDGSGNYLSNDLESWFVDLMFKYKGWSVASEYANRVTKNDNNGFGTGQGIVIQGGYVLPSNWEFAGRFTDIDADDASTINDITEYTFGISKYVREHNLKMQTDYSYQDIPDGDNQTVFRFQVEVAF